MRLPVVYVTHAGQRFVVSASRDIARSRTGFAALVDLVGHALRRDHGYEVHVWARDQFPFGRPSHREEVPTRDQTRARIRDLAASIESGTWSVPSD